MSSTTVSFLALAIVCWGSSAFFDKICFRHFPGSAQAADVFTVRLALTILLLAVPVAVRWPAARAVASGAGTMGLVWVAASVVTAMSGIYFYLVAMSGADASKIVPLSSTYPLVTFTLAVAFLGERFDPNRLIGTFLVCLGVFFLSR